MKNVKNKNKNKHKHNPSNKNVVSGTPVMRPKNQGATVAKEGQKTHVHGTVNKEAAVPASLPKTEGATSSEAKTSKDETKLPSLPAPESKTESKPASTGMTEAQRQEAQAMVWKSLNAVHYGKFQEEDLGPMHNWLIQGETTYLIHKNRIGMFGVKHSDKGLPGLPTMVTAPAFIKLYVPKIPEYIYRQIISFFRAVMDKVSNSEAFAQVYWDTEERKYVVHIPDQEVSGARVKYDTSKNLNAIDSQRYIFVFECHSHNSMAAFFSGVDDADEKETRIYGVFGRLDKDLHEEKFRVVVNGHYLTLSAKQIFDIDEPKPIEFPKEWLDMVKPADRGNYYGRAYTVEGGGAGHHRFPGYNRGGGRIDQSNDPFPQYGYGEDDDEWTSKGNHRMAGEQDSSLDDDPREMTMEEVQQEVEDATESVIQLTEGFQDMTSTWAFVNCIHQYGMVEDVKKALDEHAV